MAMRFDHPTAADLPVLHALWWEAFGDPDSFIDRFFCTAYHPSRCRCAFADDVPAAALYWFDCECEGRRIAYLYGVATFAAFRGQGICRALMADTHRMLTEDGYAAAILVPGEGSLFDFYARMGYRTACTVREFTVDGAPMPVSIRSVDAADYAALRRKLLPERGVIQEGENLAFLAGECGLFAGENFLLAARMDGDRLTAAELLGDADAAPGIVAALGCRRGRFRTPGDGRPFAMMLPLCEDFSPPAYLGLAFD